MKNWMILLSLMMFSTGARADLFLEPHLSIGLFGSASEGGVSNKEYDTSDVNLGLKAGYSLLMFNFGLDYSMGTQNWEIDAPQSTVNTLSASGAGLEEEFDSRTWAFFAGVEFPILVRAWLTYYFSATLEDTNNTAIFDKGDELKGSGFGLGVGFTPFPLLSLNLEYKTFTYDTLKDQSTGEKSNLPSASSGDFEHSQFYIGISMPITI